MDHVRLWLLVASAAALAFISVGNIIAFRKSMTGWSWADIGAGLMILVIFSIVIYGLLYDTK